MSRRFSLKITTLLFLFSAGAIHAAQDVPVPASCTADVNQQLLRLISSGQSGDVYNVMVCGTTISASRSQKPGRHSSHPAYHQIFPVLVTFSDGSTKLVQVVTNDNLDGHLTAPAHVPVFAYGRAYFDHTGQFAAGVDDVHCATSSQANNGWIVINGQKHPPSCN